MLIPLDESKLETILKWRNQEEVRNLSFNDHIISKDEHYHWWTKVKDDPYRQWLLFYDNNKPLGVVNYYDIKPEKEAYWGSINTLKIKNLKCEIFRFNKAALFMHKRSGYQEIDSYQHIKGDVVVLQLHSLSVKDNGR